MFDIVYYFKKYNISMATRAPLVYSHLVNHSLEPKVYQSALHKSGTSKHSYLKDKWKST